MMSRLLIKSIIKI